ncbi:hypothetical protein CB7_71 [Pectobacterium phage vB_PatM_CB7]|nr:hypothetical protein CB7_71 [Pectobacterium phage vB_PatM_CB7]
MMIKLMVPVVRDMIAEREGIESMVGEYVEVIKLVPRFKPVLMATPGMGKPKTSPVNKPVYLVRASKSRWVSKNGRCDPVTMLYKGYQGNDVYSAEELGL